MDFKKLIRDVEPEYGFINDTLLSLQTTREMCAGISNIPDDELRILGPGRGEMAAIEAGGVAAE